MHVFRLSYPVLCSHLLAVQTANCFLFVVLEVAVRCLGHVKNCIVWLIVTNTAAYRYRRTSGNGIVGPLFKPHLSKIDVP